MNVPCPKCHGAFKVPDEVMTRGVAHVVCQKCRFKFVIRLGDPGSAPPKEEPPPGAPLQLEGVKTSGAMSATSGVIGDAKPKFIAAETMTSIRVDPEFQREIHKMKRQVGEPIEEPTPATPLRPLEEEPTPAVPPPAAEEPTPSEEPTPAAVPSAMTEEPTPAAPPPAMAEEPTPAAPPPVMAEEPTPAAPPPAMAEEPTPAAPPPAMVEEPTPAEEPTPEEPTPAAPPPVMAVPTPSAALAAQPTEEMPAPAPPPVPAPASTAGGFEAFRPVDTLPTPPPGAEVYQASQYASMIPQTVAGQPVMAVHQVMPQQLGAVPYQHPLVLVITPQPEELQRMERELQQKAGQPAGRGMRALGLFMTFVLLGALVFLLYVLYKNDWSLDLANLGEMVENAFGSGAPREVADELRNLDIVDPERPIVELARLKTGLRVLTVQGVVRNNDTRTRRFIYVQATVLDNHMRPVTTERAPAGNIFSVEQLASMTPLKLRSSLNPAGSDGSNARLEPGQSVAFMVVVTKVPHDFTPARHRVHVEVVQAELYDGP
jgi:hypothetical protein